MTKTLEWNSAEGKKFFAKRAAETQEMERQRKGWENFLKHANVNDLALKARDLFDEIHFATGGTFNFVPQYGWHVTKVEGVDINRLLYASGEAEIEIWRRVFDRKQRIEERISLLKGKYLLPYEHVNAAFSIYGLQRDFGTVNDMPRHVESAFNHLCPMIPFKVVGFDYPHHPLDDMKFD